MIKELDQKSLSIIQPLIEDYLLFEKNSDFENISTFNNNLRNELLIENNKGYYYIDEIGIVSGLILTKSKQDIYKTGFVSHLYIKNSLNNIENNNLRDFIEKSLIKKGICDLKDKCDFIEIKKKICEITIELLLSQGFSRIQRANMITAVEKFSNGSEPKLDPKYSFLPFNPSKIAETARLIVETNIDEIDSQIFPEFTSSSLAEKMIRRFIDNEYGEFNRESSSLLLMGKQLIGYCFVTIFDKTIGFILDVGVLPEHRGKGLGKNLIINFILNLKKSNINIRQIELGVTLSNKPAINLYKKLGFEFSTYFDVYIWRRLN